MFSEWQYTPYILPLVAAAAVAAWLALYAWRRRQTTGAAAFVVLTLAAAGWAAVYTLELASADRATILFWVRLEYPAIVTMPLAWLGFVLQYTGRGHLLTRRNLLAAAVIPFITILLAFSNEAHHLIWDEVNVRRVTWGTGEVTVLDPTYGTWFWVHSAYSYLTFLAGTVLMLGSMSRSPQLYRRQAGPLIVGALAPWIGNVLYLTGRAPAGLDLTPLAFTVSVVAYAWAIFRFRLLDLAPVARNLVVDSMSDGMLVLDQKNRIVDLNPAAEKIVGQPAAQVIGQPAGQILSPWPELVDRYRDVLSVRDEIRLPRGEAQQDYELRIMPLTGKRGRVTGRLVVLRDITEQKQAETAQKQAELQVRLFAQLAQQLNTVMTPKEAAWIIVRVADELLGWDACSLSLCAEGLERIYGILNVDLIDGRKSEVPQSDPSGRISPLTRKTLTEGAQLILRETPQATLPDLIPFGNKSRPSASLMFVPIRNGPQVNGVLTIQSYTPNAYTNKDLETLQALADHVGGALDRIRIETELRAQKQLFENLVAVARATAEEPGLRDTLRRALEMGVVLTNALHGSLFLLDSSGNVSHSILSHGQMPPQRAGLFVKEGLAGWVAQQRQAAIVADTLADERWLVLSTDKRQIRSALAAPIASRTELLGILTLTHEAPNHFTDEHLRLMQAAADQMALALRNARLYSEVRAHVADLDALIASSRDGFVLISLDGRLRVVNAAALKLVGLPGEPEQWVDQPVGAVVEALRRRTRAAIPAFIEEIRRVRRGDGAPNEGEYRTATGVIRWLSLPVMVDAVTSGRLLALYDITEQRLLEQMRDDLTQTMVHDLRNPLTAIAGALEMLEPVSVRALPAGYQQMLTIASRNTQRMLELLRAILDISRMESGRMWLEPEPVYLADLVGEVFQLQSVLAQQRNLALESDIPSTLPPALMDPDLGRRILQNLLDNAIKFTPAGGRICVAACLELPEETEPDGPPMMRVTVTDNGFGIAHEMQGRLFDKFITGQQDGRGSGLGLAFCRLAVEAHGGRIWVESEPDQGSAFHFTLPALE
ncbi:MAG: GAF domain-containing protein [Chloroflexi bacterium]|nr:GAF domain-containing protein [Chloroflexota bacterium]MCI0647688.1 GAF domain-containing protein [Chloroflexota bacterium]MCI0730118.1 GAF domain-containing protein [Chloroflexota bacterium]